MRPHTYRIGGVDVPLRQFWIARYPITVAQFSVFAAGGYQEAARHWWPLRGRSQRRGNLWSWMAQHWRWSAHSQPVIGVDWYEMVACCTWLTAELRDPLPDGYAIRLPTEAEWEGDAPLSSPLRQILNQECDRHEAFTSRHGLIRLPGPG
ncbi:MAG: formylglycine-generating enzyme family protein [Chloroflexales bacterium]|nr:formylglycine-generating enzyme family protein [Chloroflexales bacterium]